MSEYVLLFLRSTHVLASYNNDSYNYYVWWFLLCFDNLINIRIVGKLWQGFYNLTIWQIA